MNLFNMHYDKPGPGISKDAPPPKAVPRFFSILGRKFFDFIKLNLLFCIPTVIVFLLTLLIARITSYTYLILLPVILLFPFLAGLTLVTRNYAREEHAFIFSDFFDAVKENWKNFLIDGVICYLLAILFSISIPYYVSMSTHGILYFIAAAICSGFCLLVVFSQYYIPVMIVTFDLNMKQILKNSLIFSILGIWRNLLVTVVIAVFALLLYLSQIMALTITIAAVFMIFLIFSLVSFLINFAVYPLIKKMMIDPYTTNQNQNGEGDGRTGDRQ